MHDTFIEEQTGLNLPEGSPERSQTQSSVPPGREWRIEDIAFSARTRADLTLDYSFQTQRLAEIETDGWLIHTIVSRPGIEAIRVFLTRS